MKIYSRIILFCSIQLCLAHLFSFSQGQNINVSQIDSTFLVLKKSPNTKDKVNDLIHLFQLKAKKHKIDYTIIDNAISVGKKIGYTQATGYAYFSKGVTAKRNYDYYKAIKSQNLAIPYLERAQDTVTIIKCLNSIGIAYRKANIVDKSFNNYFKAYKLAKKINYVRSMAIALNGIGNLFTDTEKYDIALYYFRQALELEKSIKNKRGIEYDYVNIGEVHLFLGNYDSAHIYTQKAYDLSVSNSKKYSEVYELSLFGKIYQKEKKFQKSNEYYQKALKIFFKIKNPRYISNTLINMGSNKISLNNYQEGVKDIQKGLKIALKIGSKENVVTAYKNLSTYYFRIGKYKEALKNYKSATVFKDSILNKETQKELINTKIAYDTYQKEEEIHKLEKVNKETEESAKRSFRKFMFIIIVGIILLVALSFVFILYRKNTLLEIENLNSKLQNRLLELDNELPKEVPFQERIKSFELTERETDILKLIAKGLTNDEIAKELFISKNTVKYHSKNLYIKLNVKNRVQAIKAIKG